ncbi:MAG: ABC transporter permease subunit/CPBP intramembrane protease [Phycisphaerae bacterium]
MSAHARIRTIYVKELTDILRDRRTLIAMIVVPIVLYPLLMLGSIQAVSFQVEALDQEELIVGIVGAEQEAYLALLIDEDRRNLEARAASLPEGSEELEDLPKPLANTKVGSYRSWEKLTRAIQDREVHVGVFFHANPTRNHVSAVHFVDICADMEEVRSRNAFYRIKEMLKRVEEARVRVRLQRENLPESFVHAFRIETVNLASPPSMLGQILPLILILMTITGAIYPAIDVTAGERERGTLESLMVCPVPVIDLIVGKFLVVTTVSVMGAALNLASVSATVYFGGFDKVLSTFGGGIPLSTMAMILICLIPFAVLMSAIMIAVCSYARTFKEAQNYVTPVILAVLIPGGIAALPATKAEGIMLVMPVGNMVLLARDFLLGAEVPWSQIAMVLLSTTLYAGAAVAVAATVFGTESVVFSDSGSLKNSFNRRLIKPARRPGVSMSLMTVALLFPTWFFIQASLSPTEAEIDARGVLYASGTLMPILFVLLPVGLLVYWRIGLSSTLGFRLPAIRFEVAALLIGLAAWVPAHELSTWQVALVGMPKALATNTEMLAEALRIIPLSHAFLFVAVVPAVCEELLFRGFLLSGLRTAGHKWVAIATCGVIFGVFHFFLFKFPVTAMLGMVLAYLCWQSRSILPSMMAHLIHNAIGMLNVRFPESFTVLVGPQEAESAHLPGRTVVIGAAVFAAGLWMASGYVPFKDHPEHRVVASS